MALGFAYTADLLELLAIIGCLQLALAAALVQFYVQRRKSAPPCPTLPPVSILVPLHGAEPGLFDRLAALCSQDYAAPVQLVLATQSHIPVSETVQRLKRAFPNVPIEYISDHREHGASRKFSNLINMMPFVHHDHLVLADSDVQVGPDYLVGLMAELQQPGVEAVTCLYRGRGTGNFWARLTALSINADFLPKVVASLACHLAQPCLGPTIAIRRQMLNRIGGFSRVSNYLGADYLIGQAVRAAGGEVRFAPFIIECACFERSRAEFFARQLRAARTIKTIKPWAYAGTIITHPLPLALLAALFNRPTGFLLAAAAISCRMLLYFSVERAFHLARQHYFLIVVHDLIAFAVFVASYFGQTVIWRGHRYHLTPSLRLVQVNVDADSQAIQSADSAGH